MAADPRHVLAAFLTISMFAMLGNMIKRDHFDSVQMSVRVQSDVHLVKLEDNKISAASLLSTDPWKVESRQLNQCWTKPVSKEIGQSNGFISFSLTSGPDLHGLQLADAVVIARHLGATLILPDIRGREPGRRRKFQDLYDSEKFMSSFKGVINIVDEIPPEIASRNPAIVRVPNHPTEDFIAKNIEPIFRSNGYLKLATHFPAMKSRGKRNADLDSTCLAMFGSLELKPAIREVADLMMEKLRSDGRFVAVDLRSDVPARSSCKEKAVERGKFCYNAHEIAGFLNKAGFAANTTVYLTQTWWDESLSFFKAVYPNSYVKDDLIPAEKKGAFLEPGRAELLQRALDFYICSRSDAFVPAVSGGFYGNVAGKRIAAGRTRVLVPSAPSPGFLSPFVSRKNHFAYSCYC